MVHNMFRHRVLYSVCFYCSNIKRWEASASADASQRVFILFTSTGFSVGSQPSSSKPPAGKQRAVCVQKLAIDPNIEYP